MRSYPHCRYRPSSSVRPYVWETDLPVMAPYRCPKNSSTASKYHASSPSATFLQSALSSSSQDLFSPRKSLRIPSWVGHWNTRWYPVCSAAAQAQDLLYVIVPLVPWTPFRPSPCVGTEGVPVPIDCPWVEAWLLVEGFAGGFARRSNSLLRRRLGASADLSEDGLELRLLVRLLVPFGAYVTSNPEYPNVPGAGSEGCFDSAFNFGTWWCSSTEVADR